ncbi:hypothetical protein KFK14_11270 [Sphingobium phenoxybenzoativorans]|uniref:Uncharacterized protein n=1 Tax=Sphingobium phenoxybenzoativorans TaxID=1592790 RepID=A0A975KBL1_9SPHN|nr:hypothetical protein [Sphingobium phenoxybenzoativorans]QUT07909.1 hypothetical protein KFK14_11270 [Sphingobium phenoxybenzoativorans]
MDVILLTGLMKMELRDGRTIRLCDGNFLRWGADLYESSDETFGTIGSMDVFREGVGDEVPNFRMTFLPASTAAATAISAPGMQGSRVRFWIAEVDAHSGLILGEPDLQFDGQIDRTILRIGRGKRELDIELVSTSARLLSTNEGNSLNPRFHKLINPGEKGEDNATGLGIGVAWGTESQVASGGGLIGSIFGD